MQGNIAKVLGWKVESKRGENIQGSRNRREEEGSWLGGKVIRIAGHQQLVPAGSRSSSAGSSR